MKTTLITGASGGIGAELAKLHAAMGNNLVLVARSENKLIALKSELEKAYNIDVQNIVLDLSEIGASQKLFDLVKAKNISIDYLINNAGFGAQGEFADSSLQNNQQMIQLNIATLTDCTHLFLQEMIQRKSGKIMNVASTAAFQPGPSMAVYFATKAYVLHFSEAVNAEVKKHGITVTALCPGATDTGFFNAANMTDSALIKGKKLPTSAEVAAYGHNAMLRGKSVAIHGRANYLLANTIRFSTRDIATFITGKVLGLK